MSLNRNSLGSLLMIVIFLVLIAIAAVSYGSNSEQKAEMEKNIFWQKTFAVLEIVKKTGLGLISMGLGKKTDNSDTPGTMVSYDDNAPQVVEAATPSASVNEKTGNSWTEMVSKIKEEWQKGGEAEPNYSAAVSNNSFIEWQKTATGAEIIFRGKNDEEYKLPLPFRFLSQ